MKRIRTLPHLLAFDAAARHESFSMAAKELCLTTGAVSRHIKNLETKLGETLFYRGHKKVTLTSRGQIFALTCKKILDDLSVAETSFMEGSAVLDITVNCLPTFAMYWLIPRLADFHHAFPHIHVNVVTSTGMVTSGSDIAVRRDPAHFRGIEALPFLIEKSVLVCSPDYFHQQIMQPANNTLIHIRVRSDLWRKWSTESLRVPENVTRHLYLDHTFAAIQAAEDSLGIALVPQIFCEKHLTSGRLVMLNEFGTLISGTYFLVMQTNIKPGIQEFSEWLGKNIAAAREQP
ncbi:TPA: LysR family transcriptional regulator [Klebsiella pneumoniae]|jgi:LysR family glycine cleavage system transcriptional activator|nr:MULTISPECIES: LysR substrate-binding domain-containing protein [Klebsiella]EEV6508860.1 LysR family transcriptional regulator [Escherichia coli]HAB5399157.1 LysR family transcriptional regulator [Salmonella enterica subsp. enterica serovar Mbandaka]HCM5150211.1 LysR family transcriptional regulator [Klebsiella aerogenes]HDS3618725.1 LysR family transcriptional regulator [Klebsiella pneumoniae subsp. pneumoniae]EIX9594712.1 LysR family transcriptional regulator [Klebsiella pneumoniae]